MVKSMEGRRVAVTGANSGIGLATARGLAQRGAEVVLVCRDKARGGAAIEDIQSSAPDAKLHLMLCDLSDQAQIQWFCRRFRDTFDRLDVLINNAGCYFAERDVTPDGLERTFALNHMGYFLAARGLLPSLERSQSARIVNVSSMGHKLGAVDFDDLQYAQRRYKAMGAYCASKLFNIHFTTALARRLSEQGITVNALHPGAIRSGFAVKEKDFFGALVRFGGIFLTSPERGARTSIYLASDDAVCEVTGQYFINCKPRKPSKAARREADSERLWSVSESLITHDPLG